MVVFYSPADAEEELVLISKRWTTFDKQRQEERLNGKRKRRGSLLGGNNETNNDNNPPLPDKVTFAEPEVTVCHECPHVPTQLEKEACFIDRRDRLSYEQDRIKTALAYENCLKKGRAWIENNVDTIRGLEDFFTVTSKEHSRREHMYCVLRAAARIKHEGYASEEAFNDTLRYISSESSAWARQKAHAIGVADRQALQWI